MKKVFVLCSAFAVIAMVGCKKEGSAVDQKVIISELFTAGMSWNSQQKSAAEQGLKSSYPINISVDNTIAGPAGGNIHVIGSVTGSMNFDDVTFNILGGTMLLGLTETINDYGIESEGQIYTMNGAPYISLAGTFTLQPGGSLFGTQSSMEIGGGIQIVGPGYDQTMNIDITININASGTGGDVSGVIDGVPINYSF
jgi:hypothetical protein